MHGPCTAGISTGTAGALNGGVTMLVDMPLNSFPVTTVLERLKEKQALVKVRGSRVQDAGQGAGL